MACGCPVIASNTASLPEVVGNAGVMVNPYSVDELAKAIFELLSIRTNLEISEKGNRMGKTFYMGKMCA